MATFVYILLGLTGALLLLQLWVRRQARRLQGEPAPDFAALVPHAVAAAPRVLFYFYGERCGSCRALAPLVDRLAQAHPHLVKVDVACHPEAARRFRVMGTPTFVLVEEGKIAKVVLGSVTEHALTDMLLGRGR